MSFGQPSWILRRRQLTDRELTIVDVNLQVWFQNRRAKWRRQEKLELSETATSEDEETKHQMLPTSSGLPNMDQWVNYSWLANYTAMSLAGQSGSGSGSNDSLAAINTGLVESFYGCGTQQEYTNTKSCCPGFPSSNQSFPIYHNW